MELVLDQEGHVLVQDGKPVYRHSDGKEAPFDAAATMATISRLNGEAKGHREAKEAAEAKLKHFEGLDPAKAKKALETLVNIDQKKLLDAGEVEAIKRQATEAHANELQRIRDEFTPVLKERDGLREALHTEKIGNRFAMSKFISEKLAIPNDLVQAAFGTAFKFEDGKVVAYGKDGNKVFSKTRIGEPADFDEALEILVDAYPFKDHILKGTGASGGGAHGGNNVRGGRKTYSRAQIDEWSMSDPARAMEAMREVNAGKADFADAA